MEELETSPEIMTAVIGNLKYVRSGTTPLAYFFDNCTFGGDITISGIQYEIKLIQGRFTFCVGMECQVERGTKEVLSTNEQKGISPSLDHCYTEEITYNTMEYVVVQKPSTALTN